MVNKLHYQLITEFKKQFYKDLLTTEHLKSGEIRMDRLTFPDGGIEEGANVWGYILKKNGNKYILPSKHKEKNSFVDLHKILPILTKKTMKVAFKGVVYNLITEYASAKFKSERVFSFKHFFDILTSLEHSNKKHLKLMWFIGLTNMFNRLNTRISTPPGFGKDSNVDIVGNLFGNASTIVSPTLAKLEFMTTFKWLSINEAIDIGKAEWRVIEQFLLDAGAFKPEIAKHSRATSKGVSEMLDISDFSLSLFYNDIDNYPTSVKYFDDVVKDALKDRFPYFRFYGHYLEDFNNIKDVKIEKYVKENFIFYKNLIYTFTYFKKNLSQYNNKYTTDLFDNYPARWKTNLGRILKTIDIYCDNQEEFDYWAKELNDCIKDYKSMLQYPNLMKKLVEEKTNVHNKYMPTIKNKKTFTEKNEYINSILYKKEEKLQLEDTDFW